MTRRRRLLQNSADWTEQLEIRLNLSPLWASDDFDFDDDDQDHDDDDREDSDEDDEDDDRYEVDDDFEDDDDDRYDVDDDREDDDREDDDRYESEDDDDDYHSDSSVSAFSQSVASFSTRSDDDDDDDDESAIEDRFEYADDSWEDSATFASDVNEGTVNELLVEDDSSDVHDDDRDEVDDDAEVFSELATDEGDDDDSTVGFTSSDSDSSADGDSEFDEPTEQSSREDQSIDEAITDVANKLLEAGTTEVTTDTTADEASADDTVPSTESQAGESNESTSDATQSESNVGAANATGTSDNPELQKPSVDDQPDGNTQLQNVDTTPNVADGENATTTAEHRESDGVTPPSATSAPTENPATAAGDAELETTTETSSANADQPTAEQPRAASIAGFPLSILFGRSNRSGGSDAAQSFAQLSSLTPFAAISHNAQIRSSRLSLMTAAVLAAGLLTAAGRNNRRMVHRIAKQLRIAMTPTRVQDGETLRDECMSDETRVQENLVN